MVETVEELFEYLKKNRKICFVGWINGMMVVEDNRTFLSYDSEHLTLLSSTGRTIRMNLKGVKIFISNDSFTLTGYKPYSKIDCFFKG